MELVPFPDFTSGAWSALAYLHDRLGFDCWMVTRVENDDAILVAVLDESYGLTKGTVLHWPDTLCARMVAGRGPRIAPHAALVPAYREAPLGDDLSIGAYAGVPLLRSDGGLFGTLSAMDPMPLPDGIATELPLVELIGRFLSTLVEAELVASDRVRQIAGADAPALIDGRSGLWNRRGWEQLLAAEESRCSRHGHTACVVAIDLAPGSDETAADGGLKPTVVGAVARSLRAATRGQDVLARISETEFAVLAVECDRRVGEALQQRIRGLLKSHGIGAALGLAKRHPSTGLAHAWQMAQHGLYPPSGGDRRRSGHVA